MNSCILGFNLVTTSICSRQHPCNSHPLGLNGIMLCSNRHFILLPCCSLQPHIRPGPTSRCSQWHTILRGEYTTAVMRREQTWPQPPWLTGRQVPAESARGSPAPHSLPFSHQLADAQAAQRQAAMTAAPAWQTIQIHTTPQVMLPCPHHATKDCELHRSNAPPWLLNYQLCRGPSCGIVLHNFLWTQQAAWKHCSTPCALSKDIYISCYRIGRYTGAWGYLVHLLGLAPGAVNHEQQIAAMPCRCTF